MLSALCNALINVDMYDTMALAYVMAQVPLVLGLCINMKACNIVAMSLTMMSAVASDVPVVVAMTGSTVNMAKKKTMATTTLFLVGITLAARMGVQSGVQTKAFD